MKIPDKILAEFNNFISLIDENDNVAILHHTDMDGISSGVLVKKGINKFNITPKLIVPQSKRSITKELLEQLKEKNITKIIAVDIPLEQYPGMDKIKELNIEVLVIDHHPLTVEQENNIIVIKSSMLETERDPSTICAANLVYQLFNSITDFEEVDWIAALGMVGDSTYNYEKEFVDKVLKKLNIEFKEDIFDTELGRAVSYVTYAECSMKENVQEKLFDAVCNSKNQIEIIEKLEEFEPVEKEMERLVNEYSEKAKEVTKDLMLYNVETEYLLNSPVSTIISFKKEKNKTIIVTQEWEENINISARRQDKKLHVGNLLKDCVAEIPKSSGGGHKPAGGASVPKSFYHNFEIELIKKHKHITDNNYIQE